MLVLCLLTHHPACHVPPPPPCTAAVQQVRRQGPGGAGLPLQPGARPPPRPVWPCACFARRPEQAAGQPASQPVGLPPARLARCAQPSLYLQNSLVPAPSQPLSSLPPARLTPTPLPPCPPAPPPRSLAPRSRVPTPRSRPLRSARASRAPCLPRPTSTAPTPSPCGPT